jgi:hypothetical protein
MQPELEHSPALLCSAVGVGVGDNSVDKLWLLFLAHFKVVGSNEN